jgi:hypothetical protein
MDKLQLIELVTKILFDLNVDTMNIEVVDYSLVIAITLTESIKKERTLKLVSAS